MSDRILLHIELLNAMKKHFTVIQPPLADHFTLLVDDLNDNATVGSATDIDICEYNRQVIAQMGFDIDFDIGVQTAFSKDGVTGVMGVGRLHWGNQGE